MKKSCVLVGLCLAAILCGCRAQVQWETVDDEAVAVAAVDDAYIITYGVPEDVQLQELSVANRKICMQEDGDYEILSDAFIANNISDAMKQVSGFGKDDLHVLRTERFGLPEYQFAWSSSTDEGTFVSRASIVEDGSRYYALVFSVREGLGTTYHDCAEAVFASFGLHGDEAF